MPYHKTDGNWVRSDSIGDASNPLGEPGSKKPTRQASVLSENDLRLLLLDRQVDHKGVLVKAALPNVVVVEFDSAKDGLNAVLQRVRDVHAEAGKPFVSVALANHGGEMWKITTDLIVSLANSQEAVAGIRPLLDTLVSVVDKTDFAVSHIDMLACSLAKIQPDFIPTLEKMYKVDFRASTDNTGNSSCGANWKLETDDNYDFASAYLDPAMKEQYVEVMFFTALYNGICDVGKTVSKAVVAPAKAVVAVAQGDWEGATDAMMDGVAFAAMVAGGPAALAMATAMEAAIDTAIDQLPRNEKNAAKTIKMLKDLKDDVKAARRGRVDKLWSLLKKLKSMNIKVPGY
jgi:hypothetical protein